MNACQIIERALEDKIMKGEIPPGVYDTGSSYVCVTLGGIDGDEILFYWQDTVYDINDHISPSDITTRRF